MLLVWSRVSQMASGSLYGSYGGMPPYTRRCSVQHVVDLSTPRFGTQNFRNCQAE